MSSVGGPKGTPHLRPELLQPHGLSTLLLAAGVWALALVVIAPPVSADAWDDAQAAARYAHNQASYDLWSGAPHRGWDNDDLHDLGRVRGSDFELVDTRSLPRPRR